MAAARVATAEADKMPMLKEQFIEKLKIGKDYFENSDVDSAQCEPMVTACSLMGAIVDAKSKEQETFSFCFGKIQLLLKTKEICRYSVNLPRN